jgi:predicted metal-binding protein
MAAQSEQEKFAFLAKRAFELGAADAKVIPASSVVVEDRVVLMGKVGCQTMEKT